MSEQERDGDNNRMAAELSGTITMFEQILEVMPDDEMALRTLYDAYKQAGMAEKAFAMLKRLTTVVLTEGDRDLVVFLLDQFNQYEALLDDESVPLLERLQHSMDAVSSGGGTEGVKETAPQEDELALHPVEIGEEDRKDAEVALAYNLFQDGVITQDDYSLILKDLTEMGSKKGDVPSTVLHVLADRSYTHFSSVVTYMAKQSGVPFISLANFDVPAELCTLLPAEFVYSNAAMIFKKIQRELLVAVLNPFDRKLRLAVEEMTGRTCHFYLITAEEYDGLLKKMKDTLQSR